VTELEKRKVRLSEIVAAVVDAIGLEWDAPQAAAAREKTAAAGWKWTFISWDDLLQRIGDERYPEPGLRNVVDDYCE
jgi:hypothetical protein